MRRGWREVLAILAASAIGTLGPLAAFAGARAGEDAPQRVGLTIDLSWSVPVAPEKKLALEAPAQDVLLEFTDGRGLEAAAWPWDFDHSPSGPGDPGPIEAGAWRLGSEPSGHVRMRIEAGLESVLAVRRGDQIIRLPIAAVLERPQAVALESGLSVTLERVPWDALAIDFGPGAEQGVAEPGAAVAVTIGYNILQVDATEVTVRTTAVLRAIGKQDPLWHFEQRELLPANRLDPPARIWSVPAPAIEGTYVLEVEAAWEPAGTREGSRLGRLIRRRRPTGGAASTSRRVVLAVVAPQADRGPASLLDTVAPPRETEVDAFDLSRVRNTRFSAWGRTATATGGSAWEPPAEILAMATRREKERDWLRSFISKAGAEPARLGSAELSGLAWSAVALRAAPRPDRPHRLSVAVTGGDPSGLAVFLIDPGAPDRRPRVLLDACGAEGPAKDAVPPTLDWILWPGSTEPLLILINRNPASDVTIGSVKLVELEPQADAPTPPPAQSESRKVGLQLAGRDALERFAVVPEPGLEDTLAEAKNLATYLTTCGASFVVLPERLEDRSRRRRLAGRLSEDSTGPDRLDMVLRVLHRQGAAAWVEPDFERPDSFPELPPPGSAEATQQGLARLGAAGQSDGDAYQPLHPRVRDALKRRLVEALGDRSGRPGFSGVLVRLGRGPTLLGTPDTGIDDETYARFVRETFGPEVASEVPGLDVSKPERFALRAKYLAGVGRMPWLTWRSRAVASLYAELNDAVRKASPRGVLALATPSLEDGPVGAEARRVDLAGLAPSHAWRSMGLDLEQWPRGPEAPVLFRGTGLSSDDLSRDLAAHPDLDAQLQAFPRRGFLLHAESSSSVGEGAGAPRLAAMASDSGKAGSVDAPMAHAVAALDARWVVLTATAVAGREDRVRRFSEAFRRLPAVEGPISAASVEARDSGVVVRTLPDSGRTMLEIVNDTPYAIRLAGVLKGEPSAAVEDLGRRLKLAPQPVEGGRQLVLDLTPFTVSVVRVGAEGATFEKPTLYPPEPELARMETRFQDLSAQLASLNRGLADPLVEPPNAGFEQEPAKGSTGGPGASIPGGWKLDVGARGGATASVDEEHRHAGARSLRVDSPQSAASVLSGEFSPGAGTSMLVQAYLKGDKAQTVRVWIEGERQGRPYVRRSEVSVSTDWRPMVVRASDIPPGGLGSARIRFESTTPGTLWVDDVKILGEIAPKSVRLNAQRTLLAALQAFRERRYAEFARLADSHWARHPGLLALIRGGPPAELSTARPPPREVAPAASALPDDRTLR
ncbi:hypothetical protein [Paludisphaera soli]|uniref:hypothetical protein n=1 Tax=Paludisphaera soli TaxID=2712865 RepID=UPI0013EC3004|nr:hypothetical protein [Paludisphaera soli]